MPAGSDYIMAFQDEDFNFWSKTATGYNIGASAYFLDYSPAGWNDVAVQNIRNRQYKSVDRSVSVPLGFVVDGGDILKHIFYTYGKKKKVFLTIASQQLDYQPGVSYKYWYKQIYRGEVDWSTYEHGGPVVQVTTLEDGLPKWLKAGDKTIHEFPFDVFSVDVKLDGIRLHERLNYTNTPELTIPIGGNSNGQIIPYLLISEEGSHTGIVVRSQDYDRVSLAENVYTESENNNMVWNVGTEAVTLTLSGLIEIIGIERTASNATVDFFIGVAAGGVQSSFQSVDNASQVFVGQTYQHEVNHTVTLQPGEYLFMYALSNLTGTWASYQFTANSKIVISFISRFPTSYIKADRPQRVFEKLIREVTKGHYMAATSPYFAIHSNKVITSGNAIRGLTDPVLKISLDMFFKFWDSIDSVGLIDRGTTVDFDSEDNLIDLVNYIDLPTPKEGSLKVTMAKELLINAIDIGFPELKNEVGLLNSKEETNVRFTFETDDATTAGKLDSISPIKTAPYEIEGARIKTAGKTTTEHKNDNDVYALHIEDEVQTPTAEWPEHYRLDRTLNALVTAGLTEVDTVFNLWFTPKRSIIRKGLHIRGRFFKEDATIFKYKSSDQNKNLVCDGIVEAADFSVGSLATPKNVPLYLTFEAPPPLNVMELLELNPLQAFRFPILDGYFMGTMERISVIQAKNNPQQIQLRGTYSNDYLKLIKYYG